jgi:hypothetical protein
MHHVMYAIKEDMSGIRRPLLCFGTGKPKDNNWSSDDSSASAAGNCLEMSNVLSAGT